MGHNLSGDHAVIGAYLRTQKFRFAGCLPFGRRRISGIAEIAYYKGQYTPETYLFEKGNRTARCNVSLRIYKPGINYGDSEQNSFYFSGIKFTPHEKAISTSVSTNNADEFMAKIAEWLVDYKPSK